MARALGCPSRLELSVALIDDLAMKELNLKYCGSDETTDVLSFSQLAPGEPAEEGLLGDIAINVDAARRQSAERGHSTRRELDLLAAHGLLHLLGYEHSEAAAAERMREAERMLVGGSIINDVTGEV
jgi:probable rRNA maturation factor